MGDQQTLRERIKRGDLLLGTFLNMGSPLTAELCGRAGFDWVLIDLEHGAATEADLLAILYAVGQTPATPIVRPPSGERLRIGRALDLGAAGIMVPRIGSVAEVEEAVSYLRYPPDGVRGVALMTRGSKLGDHGHGDVRGTNSPGPADSDARAVRRSVREQPESRRDAVAGRGSSQSPSSARR